jgi:glycosyltransferase involved in cell wall biosynthesis
VAPEDTYSIHLTAMGCIYHPVKMHNTGNNPWHELSLVRQLYALYRKIDPQLVLHYTIKPNIYGTMVARKLGIPSICTVSGLGTVFLTSGKTNWIARLLYKISFRYPKRIFFHNQSDLTFFKQKKLLSAENYKLIPGSGIDVQRFSGSKTPLGPPFIFLMVARLIEEKGIRVYLKASEILHKEGLPVICRLLGPEDPAHKRAISASEVTMSTVEYLGETEDVREFLKQAHAVVLPSYREGLSRSLLEAASMEKPIIASAVPGCKEVVKDQINGLLCKPGDPADLALKMKTLYTYSQEKLRKMGIAGRKLVKDQFTEVRVNSYYLDAIKEFA